MFFIFDTFNEKSSEQTPEDVEKVGREEKGGRKAKRTMRSKENDRWPEDKRNNG